MIDLDKIRLFYNVLFENLGPQHWWPGETKFEICIGAILTQNTNWKNAYLSIQNLKEHNLLSIDSLISTETEDIAYYIKPSGYFNQKAKKIKHFVYFMHTLKNNNSFSDEEFFNHINLPTDILRDKLLNINGIGPETADDMLLYAFDRPVFVVDTYTYRIISRHDILNIDQIPKKELYQTTANLFYSSFDYNLQIFNEYHALIVKIGKNYCRKNDPLCHLCPLFFDLKK